MPQTKPPKNRRDQEKSYEVGSSNSPSAENAAICNIIQAGTVGEDSKLVNMLEAEDFHDETLRGIFLACQEIKESDREINMLTVIGELDSKEEFKKYKGTALLIIDILDRGTYLGPDKSVFDILKKHRASRESVKVYRQALDTPIQEIPALLSDQSKQIADMLPIAENASMDDLLAELSSTEDRVPTHIGFADDSYEGGLAREALHIFSGRPGTGKSSLMTMFCAQWIRHKIPFHFISLEMSRKEVITRILCAYHGVTAKDVRENTEKLMQPLANADFNIQVGTGSIAAVQSAILATEAQIVIIDHLGLITDPEAGNKVQEVSNITRMLKLCSMEIQKPVLACHQMSRAIEQGPGNREPRLSDLRDSGSVEQDGDNVTFLWDPNAKEDVQKTAAALEGRVPHKEIRFILRKQRNGPPDIYHTLDFDMPKFTFKESDIVDLPSMKTVSMVDASGEVFPEPKKDLPF